MEHKFLIDLPQYHLERNDFINLIKETIGLEFLLDSFTLSQYIKTSSFLLWHNDDEYYILHCSSGMLVNWYKHLGRCNTCSQSFRTNDDYKKFFSLLRDELKTEIYFER